MRDLLLKTLHTVLSVIALFGVFNLAFVLAEGYFVVSGGIRPGETIEYIDAPARQLRELGLITFAIVAVILARCFCTKAPKTLDKFSVS